MKAKIIACETVAEALSGLLPAGMACEVLRFGLHNTPDLLHQEIQRAIDETADDVDTIILGYGICSKGTVELQARRFKLVIPRADDCIALFLGSRDRYREEFFRAPGTFYLTRGWIRYGGDPYSEYRKMVERYGHEKAYMLEKMVIEHYTRLALIRTDDVDLERCRDYARQVASFFDLDFEEIDGSNRMIHKLLRGDWDEEFVVVEPGGVTTPKLFE